MAAIYVESTLPESSYPYHMLQFKDMIVALNKEHGCFAYEDGQWKQCAPISNDPLSYHKSWYHQA